MKVWVDYVLVCPRPSIDTNCIGLARELIGDAGQESHCRPESLTLCQAMREQAISPSDWLLLALDMARGPRRVHEMDYLKNNLEDNYLLRQSLAGRCEAVGVDYVLVCPRLSNNTNCIRLVMELIGDTMMGESLTLCQVMRELAISPSDWLLLALDMARSLLRIPYLDSQKTSRKATEKKLCRTENFWISMYE